MQSDPSASARLRVEPAFAEWNPADKQANIQLSDNNLSVETFIPAVNDGLRATIGKTSGRWYFEVQILRRAKTDDNGIGIGTVIPYKPKGSDNGCRYATSGEVICAGRVLPARFSSYDVGDVIGVAIDLDRNRAYFSKNGIWQGGANPNTLTAGLDQGFDPLSPEFYPAINISTGDVYTANFGATPLRYPAPTGFNAGWYVDL